MRVSTAEFISRLNDLSDQAETEPVTITAAGRDRLVLVSADEYARLIDLDRRTSLGRGPAEDEVPGLWGAMRGTLSWDSEKDITDPTGEIWDAER